MFELLNSNQRLKRPTPRPDNPATEPAYTRGLIAAFYNHSDVPLSTTPDELTELSKDATYGIRGAVAAHPNTPTAVLQHLAKDTTIWVRAGVAFNKNTPVETLTSLASDPSQTVRLEAIENPNCPDWLKDLYSLVGRDDDNFNSN